MKQYLINLLILLDEFGNSLTGGDPGETISSRLGKAVQKGSKPACLICRFLDLFDNNHCQKSIDKSDGRRAVIPD